MKFYVFSRLLALFVALCEGQAAVDRGFLFNRRPTLVGGGSWGSGGVPCGGFRGDVYDAVDADQRSLLALAGGAVVGGIVGGAAGYHLGMKTQKPIVVYNNVINQLPSPCYSGPVHATTGGGSGGGGIIGGILSSHPILSNILQGGILGGGGNRAANRATNRNILQFSRRVVRPVRRVFK